MDNHVSDEIQDLCERGWSITLEEIKELRMNSYERVYVLPYLEFPALKWLIEQCLKHCSHDLKRKIPSTYDEILQNVYVPELIRRLEDAHG